MIWRNLVFWLGCHCLIKQVHVSSDLIRNLIVAVASFRLVGCAIPTRDIWPFRCWKMRNRWGYCGGGCRFQSWVFGSLTLLPTSHHFFWRFKQPDVLQLHSSFFISSTWEARVSFWAPWAEVPQDWGSLSLLKENHQNAIGSHEIWRW